MNEVQNRTGLYLRYYFFRSTLSKTEKIALLSKLSSKSVEHSGDAETISRVHSRHVDNHALDDAGDAKDDPEESFHVVERARSVPGFVEETSAFSRRSR